MMHSKEECVVKCEAIEISLTNINIACLSKQQYEISQLVLSTLQLIQELKGEFKETQKPEMWEHHCKVEETTMMVGANEECNWCGRARSDESSEFGKLGPNEWPDDRMDIIGQNGNDGLHYERG